jgi:hypothetical protein
MKTKVQQTKELVRVATLVSCSPAVLSYRVVEGGDDTVGIFFPGKTILARRPGYEHVNLTDPEQVVMRSIVTNASSGRLVRASFYTPVGDPLANRQARTMRHQAEVMA